MLWGQFALFSLGDVQIQAAVVFGLGQDGAGEAYLYPDSEAFCPFGEGGVWLGAASGRGWGVTAGAAAGTFSAVGGRGAGGSCACFGGSVSLVSLAGAGR